MAPENRQEHRLGRQRGAGTREIKAANFSFNFPAPSNRPPLTPEQAETHPTSLARQTSISGASVSRRATEERRRPSGRRASSSITIDAHADRPIPGSSQQARTPSVRTREPRNASSVGLQATLTGSERSPGLKTSSHLGKRKRVREVTLASNAVSDDELEQDGKGHLPSGARMPTTRSSGASIRSAAATQSRQNPADETVDDLPNTYTDIQSSSSTQPPFASRRSLITPRRVNELSRAADHSSPRHAAERVELDELSPNLVSQRSEGRATNTLKSAVAATELLSPGQNGFARDNHRKRPTDYTGIRHRKPLGRESDNAVKIPITVYRPALPDHGILEDPLGQDPFPTRNAADVLSQISTELIATYEEKLVKRTQRSSNRAALMVKRQAKYFTAYRKMLQDHLFNTSSSANTVMVLESRLRRTSRGILRLREELMGIEAQRHEIEFHKDRIRLRFKATSDQQRMQREINDELVDIRTAIERGQYIARMERITSKASDDRMLVDYLKICDSVKHGGVEREVQNCNRIMTTTIRSCT